MPHLRPVADGLSVQKADFDPRAVQVAFVVHKVTMGQVSLKVLQFSSVNITQSMLDTHISLNDPSN
jgi:hypothetical protein